MRLIKYVIDVDTTTGSSDGVQESMRQELGLSPKNTSRDVRHDYKNYNHIWGSSLVC